MSGVPIDFRFAKRGDEALILRFIRELAEFEGLAGEVVATEPLLREWLFDKNAAEVIFALCDGREIGFALFFHNFSTFLGRAGIYLEDLYVRGDFRGRGVGTALLSELARIALERGCGRLEWWCLDTNTQGIDFYLSKGARQMSEWTVYRLSDSTLEALGANETK